MLEYNSAADIHETESEGVKRISCDFIQYGDYDNSCAVERANVRYLEEKKLVELRETGCYGYVKAWLLDTEENREILAPLFDYPCFDDELVYQVEMEIEDEYLENNGRDLHKLLSEPMQEAMRGMFIFDEIDRDCYEKAKDASNTYFEVEDGGNGYIDFKRLVKVYASAICDKYPAIAVITDLREQLERRPAWDVPGFYDAAEMLHAATMGNRADVLSDPELMLQVLKYAAECEAL